MLLLKEKLGLFLHTPLLHRKYLYLEFFYDPHFPTEIYRVISPYSDQMLGNTDDEALNFEISYAVFVNA